MGLREAQIESERVERGDQGAFPELDDRQQQAVLLCELATRAPAESEARDTGIGRAAELLGKMGEEDRKEVGGVLGEDDRRVFRKAMRRGQARDRGRRGPSRGR